MKKLWEFTQSLKAFLLIVDNESGKPIVLNPLHPSKAESPIVFIHFGKEIDVRPIQF